MSFLGLAFLAALPLAAIPVLLHLFDRQRNLVIDWGAMQFLVEAARRRTSVRRLKQWLLLLLRTLAIACLVLALARPLVNSRWLGSVDRNETILVIDNSLSMTRDSDGTTLFQSAVLAAEKQLDNARAGDLIRTMLTSPYPVWTTPAAIRLNADSRSLILEQWHERKPTQGRSDLLSALFAAIQAESAPGTKRRRVVVFSDGQASDWNTSDERGWQRLKDVMQSLPLPTELSVVNVDSKRAGLNNLSVNRIDVNRTVIGPGQSLTATAQIQNHGQTGSGACPLMWTTSSGEHLQADIPRLDPEEIHDVTWKLSLSTPGIQTISAEIDSNDALTADNRSKVIVEMVDRVPILVVENHPGTVEVMQDAFFVQAALGWMDGEPLGSQAVFAPTLVTLQQLAHTELHQYRAIVIPNLTEVDEDLCRRLQQFVNDGGGLWIALGPRTDLERFNLHLFADGGGLAPLPLDGIIDEMGKTPNTTVDPVQTIHPATSSLNDNERLDTGTIVVSRRIRFASSPGDETSVLLRLIDGEPLAVEKVVGRGRVIVQGIPLRMTWSELVRSQAFVVMIQDWLSYLTQPLATRYNLTPGEAIRLFQPESDTLEATLRTPEGEDVELTSDSVGGGVVFQTSRTIQPGDYTLDVGNSSNRFPFLVNRDPQESNLAPLTDANHSLLSETVGLGRRGTTDRMDSVIPTDPVWPLLLSLLIGLMLAELMLAGNMSRQRFGTDPISEIADAAGEDLSGLHIGSGRGARPDVHGQNTVTPRT